MTLECLVNTIQDKEALNRNLKISLANIYIDALDPEHMQDIYNYTYIIHRWWWIQHKVDWKH